ncbi:MAG: hydantoinase/oxoprolinase family protein [Desulfobacteraceae bacterium]|nr:hydantoinase/oxoprolinase family protein [Desulfobacteraceae bacterium]
MIIGLDVGGTHTDVVLISAQGLVAEAKVPTDFSNLFNTVLDGLNCVTLGINIQKIRRLVLSTTLTTNLVVQNKLPAVGMVTAAGPGIDPALFHPHPHYYKTAGALDHRGREIEPLDEKRLPEIGLKLKQSGVRYAGVVTKFSVRNPEHEKRMAAALAPFCEHVFMGHQFSGALNFPRRIATTYLNAAVYPSHKQFFEFVQKSLNQQGLGVPIRILKPDGGNMQFDASLDYPAQTILSGPSASVMGALAYAPRGNTSLVIDIGGTTTDMAVLVNGVPLLARSGIEIGPYKTSIRAMLTHSIGVGGDSVVRVQNGAITIGPDRAGCAMAYGGSSPTPTDAFCVLGRADFRADRKRAAEGLAPIAQMLEVPVQEAAERIFRKACVQILEGAQKMVDHINSKPVYTVHEMVEDIQIQPDHILVLGGPAEQFAEKLATLFDGKVATVPHYHVANAIGCALASTTCEVCIYADTARKILTAPSENISKKISPDFSMRDCRDIALRLLREKALRHGAHPDSLEMEIIEQSQFNMIRGFQTIGKNIRVRAQVKPGLIHGYDPKTEKLMRDDL